MKHYTCPSLEIISLQANDAIAYENPLETATITTSGGTITTTYNMALLAEGSQIQFVEVKIKEVQNQNVLRLFFSFLLDSSRGWSRG